jgi:hypothetical protein
MYGKGQFVRQLSVNIQKPSIPYIPSFRPFRSMNQPPGHRLCLNPREIISRSTFRKSRSSSQQSATCSGDPIGYIKSTCFVDIQKRGETLGCAKFKRMFESVHDWSMLSIYNITNKEWKDDS